MKPDDFRPGIFVMVLGAVQPKKPDSNEYYWVHDLPKLKSPHTGNVYRIAAVSLPFLICESLTGRVARLDIRDLIFARPKRGYVSACRRELAERKNPEGKPRRRKNRPPNECDACGGRLVQRAIVVQDPRGHSSTAWLPWCNNCNRAVDKEK